MKSILPLIFSLVFSFPVLAQDTIYFHRQEREISKILEVNPTEVVFRKTSYLDGPVFRALKTDIDSIRFGNGMKELFYSTKTEKPDSVKSQASAKTSDRDSYAQGVEDASQYYKGYKAIGTVCYFSGLIGLYGIPVPIVGSIARPNNMLRYVPDVKRYNNDTPYFNGYNARARHMKATKAWTNYGLGTATTAGVFLILVASVLVSMN